jgi:serine/threonine protein kinase
MHSKKSNFEKENFSLSNFIHLKKLGEGQFGQVFLVKNVQFGTNLYAIKCLKKEYIKSEEL